MSLSLISRTTPNSDSNWSYCIAMPQDEATLFEPSISNIAVLSEDIEVMSQISSLPHGLMHSGFIQNLMHFTSLSPTDNQIFFHAGRVFVQIENEVVTQLIQHTLVIEQAFERAAALENPADILQDRNLIEVCGYYQIPIVGTMMSQASLDELRQILSQVQIIAASDDPVQQAITSLISDEDLITGFTTASEDPTILRRFINTFQGQLARIADQLSPEILWDFFFEGRPKELIIQYRYLDQKLVESSKNPSSLTLYTRATGLECLAQLSPETLERALNEAIITPESLEIFFELFGPEMLANIPIASIGTALRTASADPESLKILRIYLGARFEELSMEQIGQAFHNSKAQVDTLKILIDIFGTQGLNVINKLPKTAGLLVAVAATEQPSESRELVRKAFQNHPNWASFQNIFDLSFFATAGGGGGK